MAIRKIEYSVSSMGVSPSTHQWGGVQYEDNATEVVYEFEPEYLEKLGELENYLFRIDFNSASAGYEPSKNLTITDGKISRTIPKKLTQYGGQITSTLVISEKSRLGLYEITEEIITIPSTIFFTASARQDARFTQNLSAYEEYISELATEMAENVENTRANAEIAKTEAENASTSAIYAQSAETNATKKASEAEQSAKDAHQHAQDAFTSSLIAGDRAHDASEYAEDAAREAGEAYRYATDAGSACVAAQKAEENARKYAEDAEKNEVDLSGYVKDTQFADKTNGKAGVVRVMPDRGVSMGKYDGNSPENGDTLMIQKASEGQIRARNNQHYNPIVPSNLDYAVKIALTDCKIEWTEAEKKAVRLFLGIDKPYETILEDYLTDDSGNIHGIKINVGEKYIVSVYNEMESHWMFENRELIVEAETHRIPDIDMFKGMKTSGEFYYGYDGYEELFIQQVASSTIQVKLTNWSPDGMPLAFENPVRITLIKVNV